MVVHTQERLTSCLAPLVDLGVLLLDHLEPVVLGRAVRTHDRNEFSHLVAQDSMQELVHLGVEVCSGLQNDTGVQDLMVFDLRRMPSTSMYMKRSELSVAVKGSKPAIRQSAPKSLGYPSESLP